MKYLVTQFKSLELALKELEPFIHNGEHLHTGRPFARFGGMRSREVLANWLICVAINASNNTKLTFCSDPVDGDGIIIDTVTGESWPTEHVMVPLLRLGQKNNAEELILKAITKKQTKGAAYAVGKNLIVFLEGVTAEAWFPNKVAQRLPDPLFFTTVWVVGLQKVEASDYVYGVTHLDLSEGNAPTMIVRIIKNFSAWEVMRTQ